MTEPSPTTGTSAGASGALVFQLQRIYLKDASLEMPHAPQIFLETGQPQIDVQLDIDQEQIGEFVTEVTVRVTATARIADKVLFLIEAKQGGIFEVRGIPDAKLAAVLGVVCPGIVYPYLRANVADLLARTGLPPIHLAEVNFEAVYQRKLAQAGAASVAVPSMPQ